MKLQQKQVWNKFVRKTFLRLCNRITTNQERIIIFFPEKVNSFAENNLQNINSIFLIAHLEIKTEGDVLCLID